MTIPLFGGSGLTESLAADETSVTEELDRALGELEDSDELEMKISGADELEISGFDSDDCGAVFETAGFSGSCAVQAISKRIDPRRFKNLIYFLDA